ncbi:MAG: HupE/UreJ family protein [Cellvibrionaceae bacterium]
MMNRGIASLIVLLLANVLSVASSAHENRPLYVDIIETQPMIYRVQVKIPPTVEVGNRPSIGFPDNCIAQAGQRYRCTEELSSHTLTVDYPAYNPSVSSFLRLSLLGGEKYTALLAATESNWRVPTQESKGGVAKHYTWLGIEHILIGLDHLLFVACLMFIAGSLRRIVITATGFTLAHSVTLVLSALDLVRVPIAPVETLIAFSILFLAVEIARNHRDSLTFRRPVLVSSSFGLLHGFGFASVLQDIGLPQTELVTGLLFFNLGVELGQVMFIGACACGVYLLKGLLKEGALDRVQLVAIYCIGVLASYWMLDRAMGVL